MLVTDCNKLVMLAATGRIVPSRPTSPCHTSSAAAGGSVDSHTSTAAAAARSEDRKLARFAVVPGRRPQVLVHAA